MALVTRVMVRLVRKPETVKTRRPFTNRRRRRTHGRRNYRPGHHACSDGMLDGVMLRMVEEATHAGYPMDASAVC